MTNDTTDVESMGKYSYVHYFALLSDEFATDVFIVHVCMDVHEYWA